MSIKLIYGKTGTEKTNYLAGLINEAIKIIKSSMYYPSHILRLLIYMQNVVINVELIKIISKHFQINVNNNTDIL